MFVAANGYEVLRGPTALAVVALADPLVQGAPTVQAFVAWVKLFAGHLARDVREGPLARSHDRSVTGFRRLVPTAAGNVANRAHGLAGRHYPDSLRRETL